VTYLGEWGLAFALTQLVEVPIVVALTRAAEAPAWKRAAAAFVATLATHPIVWFVIPEFSLGFNVGEGARVFTSEAWAFAAECAIYRLFLPPLGWRRAAAASAIANAASFGVGVLFFRLRGF
jgi:hypothetical protein